MAGVFEAILYANGLQGGVYIEPFAGGAGAGISLLESGHVGRIVINDADKAIFSFWWSVMNRSGDFLDRIHSTPLTVEEWERQREIYRSPGRRARIDIGFAAFFLNRCNRSGIIKDAGPIGGRQQLGAWKIDARFNRDGLARRVEEISAFGDRIVVLQMDARHLVANVTSICGNDRLFAYADPPYYVKGRELYLNHYSDADHEAFAHTLLNQENVRWVVTYDNVERIRELYATAHCLPFTLRYSAHHSSRAGSELLISPDGMIIPALAKDRLSTGKFFRRRRTAESLPMAASLAEAV